MIVQDEVRCRLEEAEELQAPGAARSARSLGRLREEEPSPLRTDYQRDRDRIVHSKAFRRLQYKTQVFIAPLGDHYITRLTHTVQVSQIARTIARALRLNEDLTEAIALGHDLGHTPFGHAGEAALAGLLPGGFRHNFQSLRVVDHLEKDGQGLNLTWEVREGIIKHSKVREDIL
ncbi:MAG: dNTP triphosphohydrolase, partial [Chloroflexi bacterium]|nr:dNTP triphosphohydrolase [Chloroflexota bacterium]